MLTMDHQHPLPLRPPVLQYHNTSDIGMPSNEELLQFLKSNVTYVSRSYTCMFKELMQVLYTMCKHTWHYQQNIACLEALWLVQYEFVQYELLL